MNRASILVGVALAALGAQTFAVPAYAAEPGVHQYQSVTLSPGGDQVADVDSVNMPEQTVVPHGKIVIRSATGAVLATIDPCADCRYGGLSFSPDGKAIAFIASNPKEKTAALDVIENGKVRTVTTVKGVAQTPRWSPDGKTIALLAVIGAHKDVGATQAGKPLTGEIGADEDEQRIAVVSAAGGPLKLVSPSDTWVL